MKLNLRGQPYPKRKPAAPRPGQLVHHEDSDQGYLAQVGRGLDPSTVDAIMQAANTGDTAQMCALSETIDDRSFAIGAALDTRRAAIAATPWHLVPADETPRAEEIATAAEQMLRATHPTNDLLTFGQMVQLELGSALLPGFAAPEIVWSKGGAEILGYNSVPQKHFTFVNSRTPKLVTTSQPNGIELLPHKHVLHWHRAKGGSPTRGGLVRACSWIRCFESVNIKDLLRFVERYGMPFLVAQVDEQSWKSERTVLRSIVRNFGPDGGAVISKNAELSLLQASNTQGEVYFKLLTYLAQAAEKLILGQTATSGDGGGWSNDGAQTMVRLDIRDSDCGQISETNYARILVPWVAWNYGPDAPVPTQAYDIEEAKDTQAEAEVVKTLGEAGWDLDPDQVEANTGYKVTAKEGPGVAEDGTASVSNTLNGAQLKSMVEVVQAVARKEIPRETAVSIITSGYAGIDRAAAEKILGPTGKSFFATVDVAALSAEDTAAGSALAFLLQAPGNGLALADQDRPADPPEAIAQAALPQARKATLAMFGPLQGRLDQIAAIESDTEFRAAVAAFSDEITQTADAVDTSDLETAMANTSHGSAAAGIAARAAEIKGKE